jgi:cell division protein FtsQ
MRLMTATAGRRIRQEAAAPRARRAARWPRRRMLAATAGAVLLAAAAGGWWLVRSGAVAEAAQASERAFFAWTARGGLAVRQVMVEGRERVSRAAVLEALGVGRGTPILAIDPVEAKARLEALAWVRSASVERRLPDTLYVRLVERRPLAFWQRDNKLELIDRDGVVVPTDHLASFGTLLVLVGAGAPKAGGALIDMLASEPALQRHVTAAVRVGDRRWNLQLDSGIDVALPEDDPAAAWHRLAALERSDDLLERAVTRVDMRLPDRLVVRLAPSETGKTPPKKGRQPGKTS